MDGGWGEGGIGDEVVLGQVLGEDSILAVGGGDKDKAVEVAEGAHADGVETGCRSPRGRTFTHCSRPVSQFLNQWRVSTCAHLFCDLVKSGSF